MTVRLSTISSRGISRYSHSLSLTYSRSRSLGSQAQGEVALIRLEDKTSGNLFAVCKVVLDDSPPAYEAVIDSSRCVFYRDI